jgi:formate dehydrogenase alpha subunit
MPDCTLTIDDRAYTVPDSMTVLEVCRRNNIWIPTLCHDERLEPFGGCRMCLVEVEGAPDLLASCVTRVRDKMVVRTQTDRVYQTRRSVLEIILSDHPNDCMTCEKDGDCDLQELAFRFDLKQDRFGTQPKPRAPLPDPNPMFERENSKCILCGRCVRICDEVEQAHALAFAERGMETFVSTPFGRSHLESPCTLCGQCLSTCPTAALVDKHGKGIRARELKKVRTTCAYCGVGCQLTLNVKDNRVVRVTSEVGTVPNNGNLCVKGRFGHDFIHHPDRLKTPLIKRDGKFVEATWDEALDLIARRFGEIKAQHGPDALASISSCRCTNEENYLLQKFTRAVLGTNSIDQCART